MAAAAGYLLLCPEALRRADPPFHFPDRAASVSVGTDMVVVGTTAGIADTDRDRTIRESIPARCHINQNCIDLCMYTFRGSSMIQG